MHRSQHIVPHSTSTRAQTSRAGGATHLEEPGNAAQAHVVRAKVCCGAVKDVSRVELEPAHAHSCLLLSLLTAVEVHRSYTCCSWQSRGGNAPRFALHCCIGCHVGGLAAIRNSSKCMHILHARAHALLMQGCVISQQQEWLDAREGLVELVDHLILQEAVAREGGLRRMQETCQSA